MPHPGNDPDERARASQTARRAVTGLAGDRGAEVTTRPAFPGSDITVRDVEPLAGARSARDIELGSRRTAREYVRAAREAGRGWGEIGQVCVPKISSTSCHQAVFVDQAADASLSSDVVLVEVGRFGQRFQRRSAVQRPVRPVLVVVGLVLAQDLQQMGLVPIEGAV
jgi:hypothetical protein